MSAIERQVRSAATVDAHVALQGAVGHFQGRRGGPFYHQKLVVFPLQRGIVQHFDIRADTGIHHNRRAVTACHAGVVQDQRVVAQARRIAGHAHTRRITAYAGTRRRAHITTEDIQANAVGACSGDFGIDKRKGTQACDLSAGVTPAVKTTCGGYRRALRRRTQPIDRQSQGIAGDAGLVERPLAIGNGDPFDTASRRNGRAIDVQCRPTGRGNLIGIGACDIEHAVVAHQVVNGWRRCIDVQRGVIDDGRCQCGRAQKKKCRYGYQHLKWACEGRFVRFAIADVHKMAPIDQGLTSFMKQRKRLRGQQTIPSTCKHECRSNPFLAASNSRVHSESSVIRDLFNERPPKAEGA
ncbi:hypothetical protein D3C84_288150 [compost metagenome]